MDPSLLDKYREEMGFIREILFEPTDMAPRQIYADWLDERQDLRAQILRIDVELWETEKETDAYRELIEQRTVLLPEVDHAWLDLLAVAPIEQCSSMREPREDEGMKSTSVEFQFECPKRWENLKPFPFEERQDVRLCHECERAVYYCHDIKTARKQAQRGNCVALDPSVPRKRYDLQFFPIDEIVEDSIRMGFLDPPPDQVNPFL